MLSGANVENEAAEDSEFDDSLREDESETLSDIDDCDVDVYLHNEEEKNIKMLWERVNRVNRQPRKQLQQLIRKLLREILETAQRIS
ncbi:hypothetical protein VIGAN_07195600 [Vigna angularis var. angularis]|uniref:Brf1 TBP-binding domain-containing protein n=1 Tax=Vigna angularis var. angularis TaxID=157739 RepID=A0A0S3SJP3_PHAAN|nr:hypothetical protein VIGAN_07195600 [Vigna angularis var. angularis]